MSKRNYRNGRTGGSSRRGGYGGNGGRRGYGGGARGGSYARSGNAGKIAMSIIALIVAAALVCAIGYGSREGGKWFKNANLTTWFNSWGKGSGKVADGTMLLSFNDESNGIMTLDFAADGYSPYNNSCTIKASITPETASDKKVIWTSSDTYCVTVEPTADNALIAVITCKNKFDTPITITCKSADNPTIYATCRVDYLVGINYFDCNAGIEGGNELAFGTSRKLYFMCDTAGPGQGTVWGEFKIDWVLDLTQNFADEVSARCTVDCDRYMNCWDGRSEDLNVLSSAWKMFANDYDICTDEAKFNEAFGLAIRYSGLTQHAVLTVNFGYYYDDVQYGSKRVDIPVTFSEMGLLITVDGIDLDNDNVIFGT